MEQREIKVNASSVYPALKEAKTQLIYQRHCVYDRNSTQLTVQSAEYQKQVAIAFINQLRTTLKKEEIKNIYFMFMTNNRDSKVCIDSINIVIDCLRQYLESINVSTNHIINLNEKYCNNYIDNFKDENILETTNSDQLQLANKMMSNIKILQRYASFFHDRHLNSRLIIWDITNHEVISSIVKQKILKCDDTDEVNVDYCGGISFLLEENSITAILNGVSYNIRSEYQKKYCNELSYNRKIM